MSQVEDYDLPPVPAEQPEVTKRKTTRSSVSKNIDSPQGDKRRETPNGKDATKASNPTSTRTKLTNSNKQKEASQEKTPVSKQPPSKPATKPASGNQTPKQAATNQTPKPAVAKQPTPARTQQTATQATKPVKPKQAPQTAEIATTVRQAPPTNVSAYQTPSKHSLQPESHEKETQQLKRRRVSSPEPQTMSQVEGSDHTVNGGDNVHCNRMPCVPCMKKWKTDPTRVCLKNFQGPTPCLGCPETVCYPLGREFDGIWPLCQELHRMARDARNGKQMNEDDWERKLNRLLFTIEPDSQKDALIDTMMKVKHMVKTNTTSSTTSSGDFSSAVVTERTLLQRERQHRAYVDSELCRTRDFAKHLSDEDRKYFEAKIAKLDNKYLELAAGYLDHVRQASQDPQSPKMNEDQPDEEDQDVEQNGHAVIPIDDNSDESVAGGDADDDDDDDDGEYAEP